MELSLLVCSVQPPLLWWKAYERIVRIGPESHRGLEASTPPIKGLHASICCLALLESLPSLSDMQHFAGSVLPEAYDFNTEAALSADLDALLSEPAWTTDAEDGIHVHDIDSAPARHDVSRTDLISALMSSTLPLQLDPRTCGAITHEAGQMNHSTSTTQWSQPLSAQAVFPTAASPSLDAARLQQSGTGIFHRGCSDNTPDSSASRPKFRCWQHGCPAGRIIVGILKTRRMSCRNTRVTCVGRHSPERRQWQNTRTCCGAKLSSLMQMVLPGSVHCVSENSKGTHAVPPRPRTMLYDQ